MARENTTLHAFNRGMISPLALARTDLDRTRLSAETQVNYIPRVLGSMTLRPGLKFLSSTYLSNPAKQIPFVFSTDDKALIEVTDGFIRVRNDDAVITRNSVTTATRGGTFDADITNFNNLSATAAGATVNDVAFSPDGTLAAYVTLTAGDKLKVYSISGTTLTALGTQPASIPATDINGVAFSPDGAWLAIAHTASPFVSIWAITGSGASATFVKQSNPASLPAGIGNSIAFNTASTYMAVAHATSPFLTVYSISGSTFTALAAPTATAGIGNDITFSFDGAYIAVAHDTTPFVTKYTFVGSGSTATLTKQADSGTLPTGNGQGVSYSRDGRFLAVAHTTTPFVSIYSFSGITYTKLTNPATLPDGNGNSCHFSSDNQFLVVGHATSQFITIYDFQTGAPVKASDPSTLPGTTLSDVRFSSDNHFLGVADGTNFRLYEAYQWLDRDDTGTTSVYASSSSTTVAGPTTLTNNPSNWAGYTLRQFIPAASISASGTRVNVVFGADGSGTFTLGKAYIGQGASVGDVYDFASAPTQLTFNGGAVGFTITGSQTQTSDDVNFTLDNTKPLIIAWYSPSAATDDFGMQAGFDSYRLFYKFADDGATVDATGYTEYTGTRNVGGILQVNSVSSTSSGYLQMTGTNYLAAHRVEAVSILNADKTTEHAVRVVVARGEVKFKIGTTYGGEDVFASTILTEGTHSLTFTPNANLIFFDVSSTTTYTTLLDTVTIEASGDMTIVAPWTTGDLYNLRWVQSGDIIYVACKDKQQYKIERRSDTSWSVVKYQPEDGPFRTENSSSLITVAPSATTGDVTLTASQSLFKSTNVGGLFKINSNGQYVSANITGANQFTNAIKVFGTGTSRNITVARTGTFSGTITVQRSFGTPGSWVDTGTTYTTAGTVTVNDGFDNQIVYYRIGIKTGDYTSGSVLTELTYSSGSLEGIARITGYTSSTAVTASVIIPFGGTTASESWAEGLWSDRRGWPTSVTIFEGRMWWAGKDRIVGSVSDDYESFAALLDTGDIGDDRAINRSIGFGPVDVINWLLPIQNLMLGGQATEISAKSNSFDEPITPTKFQIMPVSTQGSAAIPAMMVDNTGFFVQRSGSRVFELAYDGNTYNYGTKDLTALIPEIGVPNFVTADVQRQPDTRCHFVRSDGTVAMLIFDGAEDVRCWVEVETDGIIEDVVVLPGSLGNLEDDVYYVVNRTINGTTVRYLEKWAMESECIGGLLNKQADAFIVYDSTPTTTITGLDHLETETVVVWADGLYVGTATVSGGSITLADAASKVVVGLTYTATYKSTKMAYAAQGGTALNMQKRIPLIAFIFQNTHRFGVKFGRDLNNLDDLPSNEAGEDISDDKIWDFYDQNVTTMNGEWDSDARLCLQSYAPKPCTVLGVTVTVETNG